MIAALAVLASLAGSLPPVALPDTDLTPAAVPVSASPRLDVLYREPFAPLTMPLAMPADTGRPKAIEYGNGYYTRLKIHQIASWTMLPLFVTQYFVGEDLYNNGPDASDFSRNAHGTIAGVMAGVFAVQAVTGVWNLVDSWKDPAGGTRRKIHSIAMLAASAGFVATGMTAPEEENGFYEGDRSTHKTLAISSMAVATGAWLMMLLWKE